MNFSSQDGWETVLEWEGASVEDRVSEGRSILLKYKITPEAVNYQKFLFITSIGKAKFMSIEGESQLVSSELKICDYG